MELLKQAGLVMSEPETHQGCVSAHDPVMEQVTRPVVKRVFATVLLEDYYMPHNHKVSAGRQLRWLRRR